MPAPPANPDDPFSGTGDAPSGEVEMGDPEKKRTGGDDIDVKPAKSGKSDGDDA